MSANNTRVQLTVKSASWVKRLGGAVAFQFPFNNPHDYVFPPRDDGGNIVGFDIGLSPVLGSLGPECDSAVCGMTKDSTRMLCIPPEEGYGSTAVTVGGVLIPANSTLILEIKCKQILKPIACSKGKKCADGQPCPASGTCPPPPAPPAPPPPPPVPPPPPTPGSQCASGTLTASDCQAWIDLFDAAGGNKWIHCSDKRLDPCSCTAGPKTVPPVDVVCDAQSSRMIGLSIGQNGLAGSLPASLGNLTKLTTLALEANSGLAGSTLPEIFGRLTGLRSAYLYGNGLVGTIPASLGQLTRLTKLLLNDNALTGSIPSSFAQLTKLEELELQQNQLTGLVPELPFAK